MDDQQITSREEGAVTGIEEEIIDAEMDAQAIDLLEEALRHFDNFLRKMRFMLQELESYDAGEEEDDGQTVKSIIADLVIAQLTWVCLKKGKVTEKKRDAMRKLEKVRQGEKARSELLGQVGGRAGEVKP